MAKLETLKDNYGNDIYPNTRLDCVYCDETNTLDTIIGDNQDISGIADSSVTGILSAMEDEYNQLREDVNIGTQMIAEAVSERGITVDQGSDLAALASQIEDILLTKKESVTISTQVVSVKPSAKAIRILSKPDEGIDGISQVNATIDVEEIEGTVLYGNKEIYSQDDKFLSKVTVHGPSKQPAERIILTEQTPIYNIPEGYHDGKGKVKITTQEKSVTITSGVTNVTPDENNILSKVSISGPANRGALVGTLTPKFNKVTIPEGYHNGQGVVSISPQEKTVTNLSGSVTVTPDEGKVLSSVTINGPEDCAMSINEVIPSLTDSNATFTIPKNGYYDTTSKISVSRTALKNNTLIVDDKLHRDDLSLKSLSEVTGDFINMTTIDDVPVDTTYAKAVVLKDSIHLLGGSSSLQAHYKFDGNKWSYVDTIPVAFYCGSAVVLNNEIHILGGRSNPTVHYKWKDSQWSEVSTLPYDFYEGSAVVYNNEIHIFGSADTGCETNHYKYTNGNWVQVSTLPYEFKYGNAVVYKGNINILGGTGNNSHNHYIWTGSQWNFVGSTHYELGDGLAVVLGNELHILSGSALNVKKWHCVWNGTNWYFDEFLPYYVVGKPAVAYYGDIHILGANDSFHPQARTVLHYESVLGTLRAHGVKVYNDSKIYTLA